MKTVDKAYYRLIERMPLVYIDDDEHLAEAAKLANELAYKKALKQIEPAEAEYLNVLSDLIIKYESQRFPRSKATPVELVAALIEVNGLSQGHLAPIFGGQSRVSDFLSGKRQLSKSQIAKLAKQFSVSPAAFFDTGDA